MIVKKLNPNSDSIGLVMTNKGGGPCEGGSQEVCKHSYSFVVARSPDSILVRNLITGAMVSIDIGSNVLLSLTTELQKIGYFVEGADSIKFTNDGTNKTLEFVGDIELGDLTLDNASTASVTKVCTPYLLCNYRLLYPGGATPSFSINGTATTIAAITYGTTSAATAKGLIQTPALAGGAKSVKVEIDAAEEVYVVTIKAAAGTVLKLDDTVFERGSCVTDYKA